MSLFSYLLLLKYGCSAHADNRGPSRRRGRSPILPGTGTLPRPRPRFVRIRGLSPVPVRVPDLAGTGTQDHTLPRPRFPSGGPRPGWGTAALNLNAGHSAAAAGWRMRGHLAGPIKPGCTTPLIRPSQNRPGWQTSTAPRFSPRATITTKAPIMLVCPFRPPKLSRAVA